MSIFRKRKFSIITLSVLVIIMLIGISNGNGETINNLQSNPDTYLRIRFNIEKKNDSVPLQKLQAIFLKNNIRPLRIWIVIDDQTTAMFTIRKNWNMRNLNKNITTIILNNYKNKLLSAEKRQKSVATLKDIAEYKKIIKDLLVGGPIRITGIDFIDYAVDYKNVFSNSGMRFTETEMSCRDRIPSPELQWTLLHTKNTTVKPAFLSNPMYNQHEYPDDTTWLPNYISATVRTLQDSEETRYICQNAKWYSTARLSYFKNGYNYDNESHDPAYEQDSVFWPDSYGHYYVADARFWSTSMIEDYFTNFPDPYVDTRFLDQGDINLSIGCGSPQNFNVNTLYYYDLYVKRGESESGNTFSIQEQPGYHYMKGPNRWTIKAAKTRIQHLTDCDFSSPWKLYIPNYYNWNPCTNPYNTN